MTTSTLKFVRRAASYASTRAGGTGVSPTGPNESATAVSDATVGTFAWANPERCETVGGGEAQALDLTPVTGTTEYLKVTNFGFAIGAVSIRGVKVEAFAWASGNVGDVQDNHVKLVKAGTISGNDMADAVGFAINSGSPITYKAWGNAGQMWGVSLAPSDINDAGFGCVMSFKNTHATLTRSVLVDHVRITVYYV